MNKYFSLIVILIVLLIVIFLRMDVKNNNPTIDGAYEQKELTQKILNETDGVVYQNDNIEIVDVVQVDENDSNEPGLEVGNALIPEIESQECIDLFRCKSLVEHQMETRFGLEEFIFLPNISSKLESFDPLRKNNGLIRIGRSFDRTVYGFKVNNAVGGVFYKRMNNEIEKSQLLNDEYYVFFGDEISVHFEATNKFRNEVRFVVQSELHDEEFEFGLSQHINQMAMCEGSEITIIVDDGKIIPQVPKCSGRLKTTSEIVRITNKWLIKCLFPHNNMGRDVYLAKSQVVLLDCKGSDFDRLRKINQFENIQAVSLFGEFKRTNNLNSNNLKILKIESSKVIDFEFLYDLTNLETLIIDNSSVKSIKGLNVSSSIIHLKINNTKLPSLDFLQYLPFLETLNLDNQNIKDLPDLSGNLKLTFLSLRNNELESLLGVEFLSLLKYLNFKNNKVENVSNLDFTNNKYVEVNGLLNPIDCFSFNGTPTDLIQFNCMK